MEASRVHLKWGGCAWGLCKVNTSTDRDIV